MKKYLLVLTASFALVACGGNERNEQQTEEVVEVADAAETEQDRVGEAPVDLDGAQLIAGSDCLACHKEEEQLVGPAYLAVAQKYPDNDTTVTYLASKIIQGGSGNWGTVPMTPHPQLSIDEAEAMAEYILSLE